LPGVDCQLTTHDPVIFRDKGDLLLTLLASHDLAAMTVVEELRRMAVGSQYHDTLARIETDIKRLNFSAAHEALTKALDQLPGGEHAAG
jgi:hypothetical protein